MGHGHYLLHVPDRVEPVELGEQRLGLAVLGRLAQDLARDLGVLLQDIRDAVEGLDVLPPLVRVEVVNAPRLRDAESGSGSGSGLGLG